MNNRLIIVDSNYICYVNKFALSTGLTYRGQRTEIVYGFIKNMLEYAEKFGTGRFVFCWDSKESNRKDVFPEYKGNRTSDKDEDTQAGDELAFRQFNLLKRRVLSDLGFNNIFHQKGYESDDLIASLVLDRRLKKYSKIVISNDKDLYQLLDHCSMFSRKGTMTRELFMREYKIGPDRWAEVKTLSGCTTDNVPGIIGVGDQKAIKYLKGELNKGKIYDLIRTRDPDNASLTRYLVELPLPGTMDCILEKDNFSLHSFEKVCQHFGFESLLKDKYIKTWKKLFIGRNSNEKE